MLLKIIDFLNSELNQQGMRLTEKTWESGILHRNVIALTWDVDCESSCEKDKSWTHALQKIQERLKPAKPCLLFARIPASNQAALRALENTGFHLIECYLELEHSLENIPQRTGKNEIRPLQTKEILELEKIALASFQYSRFHVDPFIDRSQADITRSEWVKNACRGRADFVFVAHVDQQPVGFLTCMKQLSKRITTGILDLIAVHPAYRDHKIGYDLTSEFLTYCRNQKYFSARVGTQAHNIPSLRLYEKVGFLMSRTFFSYHKHIM